MADEIDTPGNSVLVPLPRAYEPAHEDLPLLWSWRDQQLQIELETTIVETKDEGSGGGRASFSLYFLPGIALMALMFMAQSHSEDVWREREQTEDGTPHFSVAREYRS